MKYENKIKELLDPNTYRKLKKDPTADILRKTKKLIKTSSISEDDKKKLYKSEALPPRQTAKVMIEGDFTFLINIRKGTRQGCPLSPLLFVLTLEVLNRNIRDDQNIKGMKIKKEVLFGFSSF